MAIAITPGGPGFLTRARQGVSLLSGRRPLRLDFCTPYSGAVEEEARLELPVWLMTVRPTAETGSIHGMSSGVQWEVALCRCHRGGLFKRFATE